MSKQNWIGSGKVWIPFRRSNQNLDIYLLSKKNVVTYQENHCFCSCDKTLVALWKKCRIKKKEQQQNFHLKKSVQKFLVSNQKVFQDGIVCWSCFENLPKIKVNNNKFGFKKKLYKMFFLFIQIFFPTKRVCTNVNEQVINNFFSSF